ncbi:MAG: PepSY domain-containing protein [Thermomonas sp.]
MHAKHILSSLVALAIAAGCISFAAHAAEPSEAALLKQAKVSKEIAAKTALAKVTGGTIKSSELEHEHGALVWSFDIAIPKSRNIHEVQVDALTGAVAHMEIETPKDQSEELEQDKKEAKKS